MPEGSTEPGGGGGGAAATVTDDVPVLPSLVAVMVVVPTASPVTSPEPDTLPATGVPELHEIARPVRTLLFASRVTAES